MYLSLRFVKPKSSTVDNLGPYYVVYLRFLHHFLLSLRDSSGHGLPRGGLGDSSILGYLLDTLDFRGSLHCVKEIARTSGHHAWIQGSNGDLNSRIPKMFSGIQSALLDVLKCRDP